MTAGTPPHGGTNEALSLIFDYGRAVMRGLAIGKRPFQLNDNGEPILNDFCSGAVRMWRQHMPTHSLAALKFYQHAHGNSGSTWMGISDNSTGDNTSDIIHRHEIDTFNRDQLSLPLPLMRLCTLVSEHVSVNRMEFVFCRRERPVVTPPLLTPRLIIHTPDDIDYLWKPDLTCIEISTPSFDNAHPDYSNVREWHAKSIIEWGLNEGHSTIRDLLIQCLEELFIDGLLSTSIATVVDLWPTAKPESQFVTTAIMPSGRPTSIGLCYSFESLDRNSISYLTSAFSTMEQIGSSGSHFSSRKSDGRDTGVLRITSTKREKDKAILKVLLTWDKDPASVQALPYDLLIHGCKELCAVVVLRGDVCKFLREYLIEPCKAMINLEWTQLFIHELEKGKGIPLPKPAYLALWLIKDIRSKWLTWLSMKLRPGGVRSVPAEKRGDMGDIPF